jgi:hypothetical protein
MSSEVRIDRLVLELPGLSAAQARELAAMVGDALAEARPGSTDRLSVVVDTHPFEPTERLARRIVAKLLAQLG